MNSSKESGPNFLNFFSLYCIKDYKTTKTHKKSIGNNNSNSNNGKNCKKGQTKVIRSHIYPLLLHLFQKFIWTLHLTAVFISLKMLFVKACVCYFLLNFYFSPNDSPSKKYGKCFLFHLKSSFRTEALSLLYSQYFSFHQCASLNFVDSIIPFYLSL